MKYKHNYAIYKKHPSLEQDWIPSPSFDIPYAIHKMCEIVHCGDVVVVDFKYDIWVDVSIPKKIVHYWCMLSTVSWCMLNNIYANMSLIWSLQPIDFI